MAPELNLRSKVIATATVIGGLLVSGCGGSAGKTTEEQATNPGQELVSSSLNQYRDDVYYRRHARVVMDACASWQNVSGGITVVENPGVVTTHTTKGDYSYLVFSIPDSDRKPPLLQQMNGPQVLADKEGRVFGGGPYNVSLNIDLEKSDSNYAYVTRHRLSQHPTRADNGQIYFEDAQSGVPLINSVVTEGPFNQERILQVCHALERNEPVPSA